MGEVAAFVIGFGLLAACTYAGFLGGRDAAERKAFATVSDLRESLTRARLDGKRKDEKIARLTARIQSARLPEVEAPEWMR